LLRPLRQQAADTPRVSEPPRSPAAAAPPHGCCNHNQTNTAGLLLFFTLQLVTNQHQQAADEIHKTSSKLSPVVAVEVLVDANFAGRVLLDLVMKILHRSTNRRASAQTKRF